MKIAWYELVEGNTVHLFDTDGELPRIGEIVYLSDLRQAGSHGISKRKYKIQASYHRVVLERKPFNSIVLTSTDPHDRYEEAEAYVKETLGHPFKFEPGYGFEFSNRGGEVILELMK